VSRPPTRRTIENDTHGYVAHTHIPTGLQRIKKYIWDEARIRCAYARTDKKWYVRPYYQKHDAEALEG
jgi:hypothetical protein